MGLTRDLTLYLHYFIGSYHGGRNESFAYGFASGVWYDYDLPSAYPTALSLLRLPFYTEWEMLPPYITGKDLLKKYSKEQLIFSYTSLYVDFAFPSHVRFPNIPVRLDEGSILYPLSGSCFITSLEFVLALNLKCDIKIISGVYIPFKDKDTEHDRDTHLENYKLSFLDLNKKKN